MTELLGGLTVVELLGGLADVSSDAKTYIEKKTKKKTIPIKILVVPYQS